MKRWIKAGIYVVMGWMAVPLMGMWVMVGAQAVGLRVELSYTIGAVIAPERLNTWPETWGYHEYFHVTVVLAQRSTIRPSGPWSSDTPITLPSCSSSPGLWPSATAHRPPCR